MSLIEVNGDAQLQWVCDRMGSIDDIGRRMDATQQLALCQWICRIARGFSWQMFYAADILDPAKWDWLNEDMPSDYHFQRIHYATVSCEFVVFGDGAIRPCSI
jgi:hypothetical protein